MRGGERAVWVVVCGALAAALIAARAHQAPVASEVVRPRPVPGVRTTMAALHQQGGVPLGWQLTLPPGNPSAGRAAFDRLGCPACHRVAGEQFASAVPEPTGPELTGMGSHHPPGYFAEALLNPDAVLIDEPAAPGESRWIGADGRSIMPAYADLTVGELIDVTAYLGSLRADAGPSCHDPGAPASPLVTDLGAAALRDRPRPHAGSPRLFFAQSYDVLPGKLADFEAWFEGEGRAAFLAAQGVVSVETWVDAARPGAALTTIIGFADEAALRTFLSDPAVADIWKRFDGFVGPHGHVVTDRPLVYRAATLSAGRP